MSIQLLAHADDDQPTVLSAVLLHTSRGAAVKLLPRDSAEALLEQVTATPLINVTGDLSRGFAWAVPGAHIRHSHVVIPLAGPVWPHTPHPTAVTVELWWAPDQSGSRRIRTFVTWAASPYDAYLIACCLWSTKATGSGAEAAFLYGPDQRIAYRIKTAAWTCSNISAETVARAVATVADRVTSDPLPDTPRTSAMHEERINGKADLHPHPRRDQRGSADALDAGSMDRNPGNRASRCEQLEVAASCTP